MRWRAKVPLVCPCCGQQGPRYDSRARRWRLAVDLPANAEFDAPTPRRPLYDGAELLVHAHRVSPGITRAERALVGIFPAALRRVVRASAAAIGCATRLTCWRK